MKKIKSFWNKGLWQKAVIIFIVIILVGGIGSALSSKKNDSLMIYTPGNGDNLVLTLQNHNNSAAVDEITNMARSDIEKNNKEKSEQIINNGLGYIKANIDNITKDNDVMEKSMYYGYYTYRYIELNANVDNAGDLKEKDYAAYYIGYYTYTYVKYPYRNVDGTSENRMEKVKDFFNDI